MPISFEPIVGGHEYLLDPEIGHSRCQSGDERYHGHWDLAVIESFNLGLRRPPNIEGTGRKASFSFQRLKMYRPITNVTPVAFCCTAENQV